MPTSSYALKSSAIGFLQGGDAYTDIIEHFFFFGGGGGGVESNEIYKHCGFGSHVTILS